MKKSRSFLSVMALCLVCLFVIFGSVACDNAGINIVGIRTTTSYGKHKGTANFQAFLEHSDTNDSIHGNRDQECPITYWFDYKTKSGECKQTPTCFENNPFFYGDTIGFNTGKLPPEDIWYRAIVEDATGKKFWGDWMYLPFDPEWAEKEKYWIALAKHPWGFDEAADKKKILSIKTYQDLAIIDKCITNLIYEYPRSHYGGTKRDVRIIEMDAKILDMRYMEIFNAKTLKELRSIQRLCLDDADRPSDRGFSVIDIVINQKILQGNDFLALFNRYDDIDSNEDETKAQYIEKMIRIGTPGDWALVYEQTEPNTKLNDLALSIISKYPQKKEK